MNLSFLRSLGSMGQGYYQGVDQRLQRQQLMDQMAQQRAQQQGLAALANAYGQPQQPPQQQMPTPPMPGQPSQPPQRPPQAPQGGPGGPPGGMPAPPQQAMGPMDQGGSPMGRPPMGAMRQAPQQPPQQARPQPLPPYTSPQAPQPPQPPGGQQPQVPPPPRQDPTAAIQSALPDLRTMADTLKKQGIQGQALFAALQQHAQFLSADGKRELALLSQQVRDLQAQAALARAGAAQTTAQTGEKREGRLGGREAGETKLGSAIIDKDEAQAAKARRAPAGGAGGRPGKPQMYTGEDGKMYSRVMGADGSIIVRDGSGRLVQGNDQPTPVTPGQQTMRNTVKLDLSEIDQSLSAMKAAGPQATASIFFESPQADTLARWRNNSLTPTEYQQYDVYANRIAGAIAGIQSMGRGQVSDEKIKQARRLVPVPGDDDKTIKTKLQFIQGIRDRADKVMAGKSPDEIAASERPAPTQTDRDFAKKTPGAAAQFKAHFGVDP